VLFGLNGSACLASTEITSEANNVNKLVIHTEAGKDTISPEIYGHFADDKTERVWGTYAASCAQKRIT